MKLQMYFAMLRCSRRSKSMYVLHEVDQYGQTQDCTKQLLERITLWLGANGSRPFAWRVQQTQELRGHGIVLPSARRKTFVFQGMPEASDWYHYSSVDWTVVLMRVRPSY